MKISYQRTGGFTGMVMSSSFESTSLPPEDLNELNQLIAAANFFELPSKISSPAPGADQFQYTITVESDEQQHCVEVGDAAVPDQLWPLLNKLRVLSRPVKN